MTTTAPAEPQPVAGAILLTGVQLQAAWDSLLQNPKFFEALYLPETLKVPASGGGGGYGQANTIFCSVPDDRVGIVIGRGGCTIKDIQARHNVKIQISQASDPGSNPPVRTVS